MDQATQEKQKLINSIVKGFAYTENGGKPNIENPSAGQSGEMKSIFQFEPATWKADAKEILGDPNAPLTPDNETYVMMHKVSNWIDQGLTVNEMASIHNSGNPNAYKENHVGVNKYGVKYDTPAYAKKVADYAKQFYLDNGSNIDSSGTALSTKSSPDSGPLNTILSTIQEAQKNTQQAPTQNNALIPNIAPQNIPPGNKNLGVLPTNSKKVSPPPLPKGELSDKLAGLFGGNVKISAPKIKTSKTRKLQNKGII